VIVGMVLERLHEIAEVDRFEIEHVISFSSLDSAAARGGRPKHKRHGGGGNRTRARFQTACQGVEAGSRWREPVFGNFPDAAPSAHLEADPSIPVRETSSLAWASVQRCPVVGDDRQPSCARLSDEDPIERILVMPGKIAAATARATSIGSSMK